LTRSQLAIGYIVSSTVATALYLVGRGREGRALEAVGAVLSLIAISLLFNVVTWYRNEEVVNAALFLGVVWAVSFALSAWVAFLILAGWARGAVLALGSVLSIPVRVLVSTLIFGVLITLGRRLRRFFAPATVRDAPSDSESAA